MDKKEIIEYWDTEAKESLQVANHLFEKKDYSYALFFGHLAIEKLLKSIYVRNIDDNVPRTHNLPRIAKAANLALPEEVLVDLISALLLNFCHKKQENGEYHLTLMT
ncbi:MAG: HEPN domain-containing protein [Desulforhopalus sp.]